MSALYRMSTRGVAALAVGEGAAKPARAGRAKASITFGTAVLVLVSAEHSDGCERGL